MFNQSVFGLRHVAAAAIALCASAVQATAPPTITAQGTALGFTLSTVVSGLPSYGSSYGVLGSAVNSDGNIIINDATSGTNYVFSNLDGQTAANALSSTPFSGFASALAFANGSVWASAYGGGLARLNNDGSVAQAFSSIHASQGLWANPVNGHLIAGNPLIDIDVSDVNNPSFTSILGSFYADGVTVSPDGLFAYGSGGTIVDLTTKTEVSPGFGSVSGADGMGVISSTNADLDGDIIVNTTDGRIVLVDHVTFAQTVLATGGGYGDYTSPDRTTGSLLLSSSSNLLRLSCGEGCGIGAPPPPVGAVPEPQTYALMLAGLGMLAWIARRRRDA